MTEKFDLRMYGSEEKTAFSEYQITLTYKTDRTLHPMNYPMISRYFDNKEERNLVVRAYEASIVKSGGKFVHLKNQSHPLFETYEIVDTSGSATHELIIYS